AASALLAALLTDRGAELVEAAIEASSISAVNLAEVVTKVVERGYPEARVLGYLGQTALRVAAFDELAAYLTGSMRTSTRVAGLSLGDRACLALGITLVATVLTADRAWATLDLGVRVQVIR
ncbi:MAG TPA: type II toxin-antitoxin system VapC family toxin, partial [Geminicoccaceae bacterium]|nr:type II toxin-antitoxin system VapC family toxin [Geminicoccaceae bacterium]